MNIVMDIVWFLVAALIAFWITGSVLLVGLSIIWLHK